MGAVDLSSSKYAKRSRRLIATAQKLRDIGAQFLVDIPRIAVIGGQSAGKSSLVEAVSGIRVPRDSGTCTRCPMEVNLVNQPGDWSCRISLRIQYDSSGANASEVLRLPFGARLTSADDVELALRRAQAAVLNYPREHPDLFLMKSRTDLEYYRSAEAFRNGTLKFSKNMVVVDIFDPDCANLSFVDLPGIIQTEEQEVVQLVEDLVSSNIQGNCLILVAVPMSDDMENQRAMRLALEADQEKTRTIGVLTKPDTLTAGAIGARRKWCELLSGSEKPANYSLKLGYYCVKLADDAERARNPSRSEWHDSEAAYFRETQPWNTITDRKQFGVLNLVTELSKLLTEKLDEFLPQIRRQAQAQSDEARTAFGQLPAPINADYSSEVLERVTDFCQELSGAVKGPVNAAISDDANTMHCGRSFIHRNREIYAEFKRLIRSTAPDFRPFEGCENYTKPNFKDSEGYYSEEGAGNGPRDLTYVRRIVQKSLTWELPNNVPFDAKHLLIDEFTREWDRPADECFDKVYQNLVTCMEDILHRHFDRFRKLKTHMGNLVRDMLDDRRKSAHEFLRAILKQEKHPLYTQNGCYLSSLRSTWLAHFTEAHMNKKEFVEDASDSDSGYLHSRAASPEPDPIGLTPMERALRALRDLGFKDITEADLLRLRKGPDSFSEELTVMADARAYFFVAYKRVIDNVPLAIEHALNQELADRMKRTLLQKLNLSAPEAAKQLKELMEEDPDLAQEREELRMKIERLDKIVTELRGL